MAANGNSGNGNTGTATSASQAQSQAAASNAAASNAANGNTGTGNTSNTSGTSEGGKGNAGSTNTSTNTSTGATNSAGLMGSLIGFGNNITGNVGNTYGGSGSDSKSDSKSNDALAKALRSDKIAHAVQNIFTSAEKARGRMPGYIAEAGDRAYTKARSEGKTEAEAQAIARETVDKALSADTPLSSRVSAFISLADGKGLRNADAAAFEGKNTGPTYNPSIAAQANTNPNIAKGSSEMGPSTPANAPAANTNNAPGGNLGGETGGIVSGAAPTNVSDATNTGVTNRGSTVANGGTSVTDSGTGGSISSSIAPPSRDASSIGLGVYNTDRANYDQDNWNRGMEVESSSLVSDEECKAFAKRAFMENSEPFKKVRISIIKKC